MGRRTSRKAPRQSAPPEAVQAPTADPTVVDGFVGAHAFLGSFHPARVELDGLVYGSAEAAYQASKTTSMDQRRRFVDVLPLAAHKLGHRLGLRSDWPEVRVETMRRVLRAKFANPDLRARLLATGDARLVNTSTWAGPFWGVRDGVGANTLGRLLEELRTELRGGAQPPEVVEEPTSAEASAEPVVSTVDEAPGEPPAGLNVDEV